MTRSAATKQTFVTWASQAARLSAPRKLALFAGLLTGLALTGCAGLQQQVATPAKVQLSGTHGSIYGGQQPVAGAAVQLYQAGTTGYGTGALALVPGYGVLTDAGGNFSFNGNYQCTSGSQVYLVASGGNPGAGTNNSLILMAALGLCDNVNAIPFVSLNEVTTVGAVWALTPFMNGVNIGAPSSNTAGMAHAFADASSLVDIEHGAAATSTATVTVPTAEINTLADIVAFCVNSTGAGDGGACDLLFSYTTPSGGATPSDTLTAALEIARNPSVNASNLLALAPPASPFAPTITSVTDWTISVAYTGSGISAPTALAIDAGGNVWSANAGNNSVTKLSHAGVVLSGTAGYTAGPLSLPSAIAIDGSGNAWIANAGNHSITKLSSSGASVGVCSAAAACRPRPRLLSMGWGTAGSQTPAKTPQASFQQQAWRSRPPRVSPRPAPAPSQSASILVSLLAP